MARYVVATAWQQLALDTTLLALVLAINLPPVLALGALAFGTVVAWWRLWLDRPRRR
jgi:hypothetical protein